MNEIAIGRLLRSGTTGFVIGCRVNQLSAPKFGGMVRVPLEDGCQVFGLINDIHIDDDGLVRQLITADEVPEEVLRDNRENRNIPVEIAVLTLGFSRDEKIFHLLPPRPPLSLDAIYLCTSEEIAKFTGSGQFGYFRHILRDRDQPIEELLAAHLFEARSAHEAAGRTEWFESAVQELIRWMRDDYQQLMAVISAVGEL